jgi:alkanesulfonate monooxygenase SsuD/methylene tetrahydromethanopterin reductase-like flavin-dependent oxidoreductase (luciferase family)
VHGFGDAARAVAAATAKGDFPAAIAAVSDEMVTTFMAAGTPDEVRERTEALGRSADSLTASAAGHRQDTLEHYGHRSLLHLQPVIFTD